MEHGTAGRRGNAFPRSCRVRRSREYRAAGRTGKRHKSLWWTLIVSQNGLERPRLGLAVSRRVGKAVRRNRMKRVLREVFRTKTHLFPSGYDAIFIVAKDFGSRSRTEVEQRISKSLKAYG